MNTRTPDVVAARRLFATAAGADFPAAWAAYGLVKEVGLGGEPIDLGGAGELYRRASVRGDLNGIYRYARWIERNTVLSAQENRTAALAGYRRAAEGGHPLAMERLIDLYRNGGLGVAPNAAEAARWRGSLSQAQPYRSLDRFDVWPRLQSR